jgi:hypothetical protein
MYFPFLYTAISATTYLLGSNFYKYYQKLNYKMPKAELLVGELGALFQIVIEKEFVPQVFKDKYGAEISSLVYNAIINMDYDDLQLKINSTPIFIPFDGYFKGAIFGVGVYESFLNGYPQYAYNRVKYSFMTQEDKNKDLISAVLGSNLGLTKLLIDNGANVEAKYLCSAVRCDQTLLTKLLIDNGANIDAKCEDGNTALLEAAFSGNHGIVKLLIDAGADIEAKNNIGETALLEAMRLGHTVVMRLLIDAGANVEAKDNYGNTALKYAADNYYYIVELIENAQSVALEDKYQGNNLIGGIMAYEEKLFGEDDNFGAL